MTPIPISSPLRDYFETIDRRVDQITLAYFDVGESPLLRVATVIKNWGTDPRAMSLFDDAMSGLADINRTYLAPRLKTLARQFEGVLALAEQGLNDLPDFPRALYELAKTLGDVGVVASKFERAASDAFRTIAVTAGPIEMVAGDGGSPAQVAVSMESADFFTTISGELVDATPNANTKSRCASRNHWFRERAKEGMRPARIRDAWNELPLEERKAIAPRAFEVLPRDKGGMQTVSKVIRNKSSKVH